VAAQFIPYAPVVTMATASFVAVSSVAIFFNRLESKIQQLEEKLASETKIVEEKLASERKVVEEKLYSARMITEEKLKITEEKIISEIKIREEVLKSESHLTTEKIRASIAEGELRSTQNYLKYAHDETYSSLHPSHVKPN
jgi:hypothetical protein